jgi:hypothetical protein
MRVRIPLFILLFTVAFGSIVSAQTTPQPTISRSFIGNAGETVTNGNLTITYTVGDFLGDLLVNPASGRILTVGFVQPDVEIQLVNTDITKNLIAFPNPNTTGKMKLSFSNMPNATYTIDVIDVMGRIMQTITTEYKDHNFYYIDMDISLLKGGVYFIRVKGDQNFHGEVKIIKI